MTSENFFLLMMGLVFSILPLLLCTLIMHFLMPKAILERYWKEPHFRFFELQLFTGAPYALMRTVMFMGVFAFPRLGKKRKLTEAYLLVPKWYRIVSKVMVIWPIVVLIGIFGILIGFYIHSHIIGAPLRWSWDMTAALVIFIGGIPLAFWLERRRKARMKVGSAHSRPARKN